MTKRSQFPDDLGRWMCTRCRVMKYPGEFSKNSTTKNELSYHCKACVSAESRVQYIQQEDRRLRHEQEVDQLRADNELLRNLVASATVKANRLDRQLAALLDWLNATDSTH